MIGRFATRGFRPYLKQAREILAGNWTGRYTRPSPELYPHQWSWDSGFIAIGYAHYAERRAMREIGSLFARQWENGMVPQIAFNPGALGNYFPEPDFWQAPQGKLTSGISMPPLHATACLHIYRQARNTGRAREFLAEMFPRLVASHRYLYRHRDPEGSGLAYIRHPWESGLDNSPAWDGPLARIEIDPHRLPKYERKDLGRGVPAEERPSDKDYDRYVFLVDLFRRLKYDEALILEHTPFRVQDVLFNSILCRANGDLVEIGRIVGQDVTEAQEWQALTARAVSETLWCLPCRQFESKDLVSGEHMATATAANFMPLFSGAATREQAKWVYGRLDSLSFCALNQGNCFTIPNYDMEREDFDSRNYWRGPVWLNINWMLAQGLKAYGYRQKADALKKDLIQLPVRFGFHEYFDSISGKGYGSAAFSWTAALFIDLVQEYFAGDRRTGRTGTRVLAKRRVLNRSGRARPAPPDLAARLMATIGGLKEAFHDRRGGRVNYQALKASEAYQGYRSLAARLRSFDLENLRSREEKLAFWINLYNTIVIEGIVELGIDSSVREIGNFFTHIAYDIGGRRFSPDEIEHGILRSNARPPYRVFATFGRNDPRRKNALEALDPRIHFALVCGSRSCAPIRFYEPAKIDEQLERAAKSFINSSEVVILPERNKLLLSQVFQWYRRDFGKRGDLFSFLLKYLAPGDGARYLAENQDRIRVEYLFYDWDLNH